MIRRILLAAALALTGALGARAAEPIVLNVATIPADNSAVVYYAQDLGFFKDAGLDVRITGMPSSPPIIAAIASGAMDIGNSVVGSAAAARDRGIPVRFIAPSGLYLASHPTGRLMAAKDSPIRTAADLNGKTIAVSGLADLTYFATKGWIDQNGGNFSTVKFVELPFRQMAAALAAHRVDAAMIIEPFLTAAKNDTRLVADVDDVVAHRFLATGWLTTDAWIQGHHDAAVRFAGAIRKAAVWANAHRSESARILLRYTKIDPKIVASMNRVEYALTLDPAQLQPAIDSAVKYGTAHAMPATDLIWNPAKQ